MLQYQVGTLFYFALFSFQRLKNKTAIFRRSLLKQRIKNLLPIDHFVLFRKSQVSVSAQVFKVELLVEMQDSSNASFEGINEPKTFDALLFCLNVHLLKQNFSPFNSFVVLEKAFAFNMF